MKSSLIAALVLLTMSQAQAQTTRISTPTSLSAPSAQTVEAHMAEMDKRLVAMDAKLTSLQTENAAQKEQISNLKTSAKAIDMVLSDLKGKYENHVHVVSNYRISGFYAQKLNPNGMPLKFLTTQQNESAPQYSSKPEAGK